jgi:hypothetical protein
MLGFVPGGVRFMDEKNTCQFYANFCRRVARTSNLKDSQVLLQMSEAWERLSLQAKGLPVAEAPPPQPRSQATYNRRSAA